MVSIPACHAGDRGSIPRRGGSHFSFPNFFPFKNVASFLQSTHNAAFNTQDEQHGSSTYKKKRELIMFKSLKYMTEMFSIPENQTYQHNHQKRYLPKPKTNFLKRSFPYRGAVLWNQVLTGKFPSSNKNTRHVYPFL